MTTVVAIFDSAEQVEEPLPEEEWTKLCEQYGEHQTEVLVGDALLIDLRGNEPTFVSIPADYKPPEVVT